MALVLAIDILMKIQMSVVKETKWMQLKRVQVIKHFCKQITSKFY